MAKYTLHVKVRRGNPICSDLPLGVKVRKRRLFLGVGIHVRIMHAEAAINPSLSPLGFKDSQIQLLRDVVRFLIQTLATELIAGTEAEVYFAGESDNAISYPFFFEESRGPLVEGAMFIGIVSRKQTLLSFFYTPLMCGLMTSSRRSADRAESVSI